MTAQELEFAQFNGDLGHPLLTREENAKLAKALARKAPIALKTAMNLVDRGFAMDLQKGLQLELDGLKSIFATEDARTGLSSILSGKKPNYIGK